MSFLIHVDGFSASRNSLARNTVTKSVGDSGINISMKISNPWQPHPECETEVGQIRAQVKRLPQVAPACSSIPRTEVMVGGIELG